MSKSPSQQMSAALKAVLVPVLNESGFDGRFPRYRRDRAEVLHFISMQYDKAGTSFFLEAAWQPPGDKMTSWGELVPQRDLLLEHAPLENRARLQQVGGLSSQPSVAVWIAGWKSSLQPSRPKRPWAWRKRSRIGGGKMAVAPHSLTKSRNMKPNPSVVSPR